MDKGAALGDSFWSLQTFVRELAAEVRCMHGTSGDALPPSRRIYGRVSIPVTIP